MAIPSDLESFNTNICRYTQNITIDHFMSIIFNNKPPVSLAVADPLDLSLPEVALEERRRRRGGPRGFGVVVVLVAPVLPGGARVVGCVQQPHEVVVVVVVRRGRNPPPLLWRPEDGGRRSGTDQDVPVPSLSQLALVGVLAGARR